ncbi:helix-turn-helix domain-containing protein [Streptomyces kaniharaensis]|uniref:Helix-turn-helix domain-containing protein n=1 Tax=Streptomyces kaniharaensis TaxID=212423 RepID=A0A6N7KKR4_9ACTN|nr:helix-turn-helix transcriptional regulator [Streptomyces kaniharaensis]MQS12056.1 helix-turn-helix domain-containing protein [Streptomyces kaniharaensis]
MGRREHAVAADTKQLESLALWLREQRQRSGLTYAAMAKTTQYHRTMLSRGASGERVPSWQLVEEFTAACGGDLARARQLWRSARLAEQKRRRRTHHARDHSFGDLRSVMNDFLDSEAARHPDVIEDFGQLCRAMVELRARSGQPSLRELEKRAGRREDGGLVLPKSTLCAILRGSAIPSRQHVIALVRGLGVSATMMAAWAGAWDRASHNRMRPDKPRLARPRRLLPPPRPLPALLVADLFQEDERGEVPGLMRDISYLRHHFLRQSKSLRGFVEAPGPMTPNLPSGTTSAGLPIRVPRRYCPPTSPRRS